MGSVMTVLCIGGLDPLGRAGLSVDRSACAAMGVQAATVCTALTAQNDQDCQVETVSSAFFKTQLEMVSRQLDLRVVKVGWIADEEQLKALLDWLPKSVVLVADPLLATSSGVRVYRDDPRGAGYMDYLKRADLVLPNWMEASAILGAPIEDASEAASALRVIGIKRLILKGGHSGRDPIDDLFIDTDGGMSIFRHARCSGQHRGTGCRLASAVAAALSQGASFERAASVGIDWLVAQISAAAAAQ